MLVDELFGEHAFKVALVAVLVLMLHIFLLLVSVVVLSEMELASDAFNSNCCSLRSCHNN